MGLLCRREDNDDVGEDDNDFLEDTDTLEKEGRYMYSRRGGDI